MNNPKNINHGFAMAFLALSSALCTQAATVTAEKSDVFVESIGINVKMDRGKYGDFSGKVKPLLDELGIRYYRDGKLRSADRPKYQELWDDLGMRMMYASGSYEGSQDDNPQDIRNRIRDHAMDYIWAVQSENEPDIFLVEGTGYPNQVYTDRNGVTHTNTSSEYFATRAYTNDLYYWMNDSGTTASVPVVSNPMAYSSNVSKVTPVNVDIGSFHHYTKRNVPNDGLSPILQRTGWYGASEKVCSEFGWITSGSANFQSAIVSQRMQAENIVSAFLEYHRSGVKRSFLHEMIDDNWGVVNSGSGITRKKSFYALRDVIELFSDATWNSATKQWNRPSFTPQALDISYVSMSGSNKVQLFQRSDGTYILAVARMVDRVDNSSGADLTDADTFDVTVAEGMSGVTWRTLDPATGELTSLPVSVSNGTTVTGITVPAGNGFLVFETGGSGGTTIQSSKDTYLRRNDGSANGSETEIQVKGEAGVGSNERLGLISFDVGGLSLPVDGATLSLSVLDLGGNFSFKLLGVKESNSDESFLESSLHWNNSALTDASDDGYINAETIDLGDFSISSGESTARLSSQALTDFVNADTNGRVTLMLRRWTAASAVSRFASKEHGSEAGPVLEVTGGAPSGEVYIEAENYSNSTGFSPMGTASDTSASGGSYIRVSDSTPDAYNAAPSTGYAEYDFDLGESGSVDIWIRARASISGPIGENDSFWLDLFNDGLGPVSWNGVIDSTSWKWYKVYSKSLDSGDYSFRVAYRETGTFLDKVFITASGSQPQ